MFKYDALVYFGLGALVAVILIAAYVLKVTPEAAELETRKIRFAAATFTGILMLLVFTAILYFVDPNGPGKDIFEKSFTGLSPIAGGIVGYLFSAKQ